MSDFAPKKRYLHSFIQEDLERKMVLLDGPRQVGKTTLGKSLSTKSPAYLNWDSPVHRRQLVNMEWKADTKFFLFDELHKYPKWKSWLKGVWDTRQKGEKILVTGSSKLDVYRRGGDSLLGRYHHYRLHPFSLRELSEKKKTSSSKEIFPPPLRTTSPLDGIKDLMTLGGFPEPLLSGSERTWRRWGKERFERIFREDIRDTSSVQALGQVELLGEILPHRATAPLSMQSLSEDLSVSPKTVKQWIELLRRNYYIFQVPPWHRKIERALKKNAKYYLWDWSQVLEEGPRFENLIASHLLKFCHYYEDTHGFDVKLYYLRDTSKREVDFLIAWKNQPWLLVEATCRASHETKHLEYFAERLGIEHRYLVCLPSGINLYNRSTKVRTMSASLFLPMFV